MTSASPLFSFVATSRNDDHGGDVLQRTQTFIHRLAEQCERHQLPSELVLVEWNPPRARASLAEVLAWPAGSEWFAAKLVIVPPAVHAELRYSARLPLFQMIAKNVGIRRAAGHYVIATNIDIVFSDELFERLKRGQLRDGVLYRSNRWDMPNGIQFEAGLDNLLLRAREEAIRYHLRDGTYVRADVGFANSTPNRFDEVFLAPLTQKLELIKRKLNSQPPAEFCSNLINDVLETDLPQLRRRYLIPDLHVNGCGDFTMLAYQDWTELRGYPEWHLFSWNIDSILLFQAHYNGLRIEEMDHREVHYHIEHGHGSGWTPEGAESLWSRLEKLGIPSLSYQQFLEIVHELQDNARDHLFTVYNAPEWGLAHRQLECVTIVQQGTPPRPNSRTNTEPLVEDLSSPPRVVAADLSVSTAVALVDGVRLTRQYLENGDPAVVVETLPETWSYAIGIDIGQMNRFGEHWINIAILVESGTVGIGLLSRDGREILSEQYCTGSAPRVKEISCFVRDIQQVSQLLFRNTTADNQPTRFRVDSVQILAELPAETHVEFPAKTAANGGREVARKLLLDVVEPASAETGDKATRAAFEPGSASAIVRELTAMPSWPRATRLTHQVMIITPLEPGARAATLDLGFLGQSAHDIRVHLHVIQGEVGVGILHRSSDRIATERRAQAAGLMSEIDLQIESVAEFGSLTIRNLSQGGASKVLVHGVECADRSI